ncbi:ATP-binding cassette domain-containing protein [Brevibacillus choshinensis]|uniref:ATP-binding cassette domain-containing protein n=1 Tax=Brevibacillus choshinensis TaxID=54911 RepID=A0ABX7FSJ0_BRECH|nr:ATP-binding cassette domain-containing protein [Brevibacillus choshinensis]QRG69208.1 ATP-binding cassette domain-containing protein [Brevibacillus choshinensis]
MNRLELHDLEVTFGGRTVLQVEQAVFERGRIYGIVGPSGAGKSTLLRVINLLEKPVRGRMDLFGSTVDLSTLSYRQSVPIQRQMAFVAQKPSMFQATVFDNVALGLRYRKLDRNQISMRVEAALEQVELSHLHSQQAQTLSGGEAQRIALARALVCEPELLLLDEPTASLDPYNITIFERVIQMFHRDRRTTTLMITHNLPQAKRLADACLFLHKGRIAEQADTDRFFQRPVSEELQDFVFGRMIC